MPHEAADERHGGRVSAGTQSEARPSGTAGGDLLPADGGAHFRGDIEGLRALAVLLVIADHLFGWPSGGFIGVDVFFVISGFLITGLLLREHERTGRISFADFYRRRVRRILPASLLVLAVTAVASSTLYFAGRVQEILGDVGWALGFSANWRFAVLGTDYLHAEGPTSPVQHYWSLAVEEQFYVVWPLVLVLLLWSGRRRGWSAGTRTRAVGAVLVAITAGSFGYALWDTAENPSWAYFSTATRAWELGVGALVAVAAGRLRGLSVRMRTAVALLGLAAVLVSPFVVSEESGFPAPWAALPVLGAALLIASGTGGRARGLGLLTNPVSRYLGATSYSLYLWHFPVIVLGLAVFPEVDATYYAATLGITALAAAASYHLVEQPIRRSNWLRPGGAAARRGRHRPAPTRGRVRWVALAAAAALVAGAVFTVGAGNAWRWPWTTEPASTSPAGSTVAAGSDDPQDVLTASIDAALETPEWPELTPGLDALGVDALPREWIDEGCLDVSENNVASCTYGAGGPDKTVVLLGDSIALTWLPGIRAALPDWTVVLLTFHACPAVQVSVVHVDSPAGFTDACDDHHEWAMSEIARMRPALVVTSQVGNSIQRLASGAEGAAAEQEWTAGVSQTVDRLAASAGRVVVLADPPGARRLGECATRFNHPSDCTTTVSEAYLHRVGLESAAVTALGRPTTAVQYVQTRSWFCADDGRCPAFAEGLTMYADDKHVTTTYSARLAPLLRQVLVPSA
ncbi:acyltransferase family protein [Blastococcus sp. URHD0036]|uniref:acyltransferase family protein n=1 Tax=Blastococcus sp. URHD0036 TaxID=1380356 RepID=UPI0009DD87AA|nr:acyltransferase family protein [Blastococcus sp. URHD0036]